MVMFPQNKGFFSNTSCNLFSFLVFFTFELSNPRVERGTSDQSPSSTGEHGALQQTVQCAVMLLMEVGNLRVQPLSENVCLLYCFLPFQFFHQAFWRILVGFQRCACWKAKEEYQYRQDFFHFKYQHCSSELLRDPAVGFYHCEK